MSAGSDSGSRPAESAGPRRPNNECQQRSADDCGVIRGQTCTATARNLRSHPERIGSQLAVGQLVGGRPDRHRAVVALRFTHVADWVSGANRSYTSSELLQGRRVHGFLHEREGVVPQALLEPCHQNSESQTVEVGLEHNVSSRNSAGSGRLRRRVRRAHPDDRSDVHVFSSYIRSGAGPTLPPHRRVLMIRHPPSPQSCNRPASISQSETRSSQPIRIAMALGSWRSRWPAPGSNANSATPWACASCLARMWGCSRHRRHASRATGAGRTGGQRPSAGTGGMPADQSSIKRGKPGVRIAPISRA